MLRRLTLLTFALLALVPLAGAQDYATTDDIAVDVSATTLTFSSLDTDHSDVAVGYYGGRSLPVAFEVHVENGAAKLKEGKVYLTGGDVHVHVIFTSGETRWEAELPMTLVEETD